MKRGERALFYEVALPSFTKILNAELSLRHLNFLTFDNFSCQQLELRDPTNKILRLLKKDERSFREEGVPMGQTETGKIAELVKRLKELKAERYVALASPANKSKYGLAKTARTFVLIQSEWDNVARQENILTRKLWLGHSASKGLRYALLEGEDAILELKDAFVELMEKGFRSKIKEKN